MIVILVIGIPEGAHGQSINTSTRSKVVVQSLVPKDAAPTIDLTEPIGVKTPKSKKNNKKSKPDYHHPAIPSVDLNEATEITGMKVLESMKLQVLAALRADMDLLKTANTAPPSVAKLKGKSNDPKTPPTEDAVGVVDINSMTIHIAARTKLGQEERKAEAIKATEELADIFSLRTNELTHRKLLAAKRK